VRLREGVGGWVKLLPRGGIQGGEFVRSEREVWGYDRWIEIEFSAIFLHFPKSFIHLQPLIKYSFLLRVFGFIKKGGEIRLGETLATNAPTGGKRCQNLIPENREMIKLTRNS
jgi:hypothetical protein